MHAATDPPDPLAGPARSDTASPATVNRLLWVTFGLLLGSVTIGRAWDGAWHATHVFDSFFSPPHVFVYTTTMLVIVLLATMIVSPRIRPLFGPGLRVPILRVVVPGPLAIAASGLAMLGLAGVLDLLWHSRFGLDETRWSTPHAMLGWGWYVTVLGFIAAQLALTRDRPLGAVTAVLFGVLVLGFAGSALLGPFWINHTPETVRATASFPALAVQPAASHTFRIYLTWNLTRTNPLFVPLATVWAGAALACLYRLDPRARVFLSAVAIWSVLQLLRDRGAAVRLDPLALAPLSDDPASWLPLPVLPAALLLLVLRRAGWPERWRRSAAGALFAALLVVQGEMPLWTLVPLVPPGAALMVLAMALGDLTYSVLARPDRRDSWVLVLAGVGLPFVFGALDLVLRVSTP